MRRGPGPSATLGWSPAVPWAVTAWLASLVGWSWIHGVVPWASWAGLAAVLAAVTAVAARTRDRGHRWTTGRTVAGMGLVAVAWGGLAALQAMALDQGPLVALARAGGEASMVLTVAAEPMPTDDGSAWTLVTVTRVGTANGRWGALVSGLRDPPPVGTVVVATATARPLDRDGFDAFLRRRHASVALTPRRWEPRTAPTGLLGWVETVRANVRAAAAGGLDGDAAGLAVGLVTGDTRQLSQDAHDDMRATGLTHLVAVSGSNVALVVGVVLALTSGTPARVRRLASATAIVVFTITTRCEPSVLRAGVMAGLVLLARTRGVPAVGPHALATAVLVLLVADPASAGSLGLVLSVAATAGVLVLAPPVAARLPAGLPRPVRLLLAATLGAQVAVAPVLLATVGEVPLVSVPANLVAVPAAAVASLVAVVAAMVAQLHPPTAAGTMALASPALEVVLAVARRQGGPVLSVAAPAVLALAATATGALLARPRSRARHVAIAVAAALATSVALPAVPVGWTAPDRLAVTAIDVGQGDALLVTTTSGHRMLVDTGYDDTAASWLRRHRIDQLDLLVITHADRDHAGGLADVLAATDVATVWVAQQPDGTPTSPWPEPSHRDRDPDARARPPPAGTVGVVAGMSARLGSATVSVLGPPAGHELVATDGGRNDRSVVVSVGEGDRVALLPGDIEAAAQHWLLASGAAIRATLLVVPHHGAATTDPPFLAAVAPRVALVSVGADNDYGHPSPVIVATLRQHGTRVHRTDREGTLTVPVPSQRGSGG